MSDSILRTKLIRLASTMPKGSVERKALLDVLAANKAAASEIDPQELPAEQQEIVSLVGLQPRTAWEGIHGYIAQFPMDHARGGRLTKQVLSRIVNHPAFRWLTPDRGGGFTVGM